MSTTRTTYRRSGPWQARLATLLQSGFSDQHIAEILDGEATPTDPPWTARQVRYWRTHPHLGMPQRTRTRFPVDPLANRQTGRLLIVYHLGWGHLVRQGVRLTPREAEIMTALRDQPRTLAELKALVRKPLLDRRGRSLVQALVQRGWLTVSRQVHRGRWCQRYELTPLVWEGITAGNPLLN